MKHISEAPPSPRQLGCYLPPGVEAVVMRALAKDQIERYQTAGSLARALRAAIERAPAKPASHSASPSPPRPERRAPVQPATVAPAAPPALAPRPATQPRGLAVGPVPAAAAFPRLGRGRPASGVRQWASALTALVVLAGFVAAGWWGLSRYEVARETPASAPRFSVGSEVRVVVPQQASTSVLRGCPTGFWLGAVGLATDGDAGRVLGRRTCGQAWWYQVSFPALVTPAWDGKGWIPEPYLAPR